MRITLKDYGEHGAVTVFGQDAIDKLVTYGPSGCYGDIDLRKLPEGVWKRELTIDLHDKNLNE